MKQLALAAFDPEHAVFVVHIAALNISFDLSDKVHPSRKTQIAQLKAKKVLSEYTDIEDVFLPKLVTKFFKHLKIKIMPLSL